MDSKFVNYLKTCEQIYLKLISHYNKSIRIYRHTGKRYGMDKDLAELIHMELNDRYLAKQNLLRVQNKISVEVVAV